MPCRAARSDHWHTMYYYWGRIRPSRSAQRFRLWTEQPPDDLLAASRRRQSSAERSPERLQLHRFRCRQYGATDGRMVPQGNQDIRRSQRTEIPCQSFAGDSHQAWHGAMATGASIRRWKRGTIDAAEWVGPYDDEKLCKCKSATTTDSGKELRPIAQHHQPDEMARATESLHVSSVCISADTWVWTLSKYDYVNPEALLRLMAGWRNIRAFPQVLQDTGIVPIRTL